MKLLKIFVTALFINLMTMSTLWAANGQVVLNKDNLFEDIPTASVQDNAKIDALIFNSSGSDIYGQIFVPNSFYKEKRPVVIIFHGFAGFTKWDDVGHALCQAGAVVLIPNHRGAWGSQGEYSVTNCIEDAINLANYARSKEFCDKYSVDINNIFLLGWSMGGNTVVNAGNQLDFVKGIIMIAPCDISAIYKSYNAREMHAFIIDNGIEALHSKGTEFMINNIAENAEKMSFVNNAKALVNKNIFIASGLEDRTCPAYLCVDPMWGILSTEKKDKLAIYKTYKTSHSLMGARIELTKDIIDFINKSV